MAFSADLSPLKHIGLIFALLEAGGASAAFSEVDFVNLLKTISSTASQLVEKNAQQKGLGNTQAVQGNPNRSYPLNQTDDNPNFGASENQLPQPPFFQQNVLLSAYSSANSGSTNLLFFDQLSPEMKQSYVAIVTAIRDPQTEPQDVINLLTSAEQNSQPFYNVINPERQNLLHYAAGIGNSDLFFFLYEKLEPICGMGMRDNKGLTPFDVLLNQKHFDLILEWLHFVEESPKKISIKQDCQSLLNAFINMFQKEDAYQRMLVNLLYQTFWYQLFGPNKIQGFNSQEDVYKSLLKKLVKQPSSIVDKMLRIQDNQGKTLLLSAIIQEDFPLAKALLEGSRVIQKSYGETILEEVFKKVDVKNFNGFEVDPDLFEIVFLILKTSVASGEKVQGQNLLSLLIQSFSDEQFKQVLPLLSPSDISAMALQTNEKNFSPFEIAADALNSLEKVKALMPFIQKKYLDTLADREDNLLHALAKSDRKLPILKQIFQGMSIEDREKAVLFLNHEGKTVFDIAESEQADETLKYLMSIAIPLMKMMEWSASDSKNKWLRFAFAQIGLSFDGERFPKLTGLNMQKDRNGNTLLHAAALGVALDNLSFLFDVGMDFESKNKKGQQPLQLLFHQAFSAGDVAKLFDLPNLLDDLQMILEKVLSNFETREQRQSFINAQDPETGNTFLHEVVRCGGTSLLVRFLLKQGAVSTIQNAEGKTAKDIAKEVGDLSVIGLLDKPILKFMDADV